MENSKVKMSEAMYFDSRIDFRIANPDVFRTAMQLPLNDTAYSAHRGGFEYIFNANKISDIDKIKEQFQILFKNNYDDIWNIMDVESMSKIFKVEDIESFKILIESPDFYNYLTFIKIN